MRKLFTIVALLSTFLTSSALRAQTLADRVPSDSFVYFGWKGHETPGTGYQGSHLQAILNAANFKAIADEVLPQLLEKAEQQNAGAKEGFRTAMAIAGPLCKHPTAVFFRPGTSEKMPVRIGVICQAGADTKALAKELSDAIAKAPNNKDKDMVRVIQTDDSVSLLVGYSQADAGAQLEKTATMAGNAKFAAAGKTTGGPADPFITMYVDVDGAMTHFTTAMAKHDQHGLNDFKKLCDATGLSGLHRVFMSGNFDGKDWTSAVFVDAPAPRTGFVKLLEGHPLDPATMKLIPSTAISAAATQFDLAALANEVRNVMNVMDPAEGQANFDHAMEMGQQFTGLHPVNDILQPLGDTWVAYSDGKATGDALMGLVFINPLRDPATAEKSLSTLWTFGANMLNGPMGAAARGQVSMGDETVDEIAVHTLQTPQFKAGWTVQKGRLIISLKSDALPAIAKSIPAASGFDQNAKFAEMSKKLSGGQPIMGFRYSDLALTTPMIYQQLEQAWGVARMVGGMQGVNLPETILPPLDVIVANVTPSADVSWTDASGFHQRSHSPFPGSDVLSNLPNGQLATAGGAGAGVAILLPSLNRARETANRIKCASNERQIGQAILFYCNENKGNYPPDLGTLLTTEDITADVFICPSGDNSLPADHEKMAAQQLATWVNEHSDYIYAGKGLKSGTPADRVVLYEKDSDHGEDGVNMLYGDGHVEFQLMRDAKKTIEELKGK